MDVCCWDRGFLSSGRELHWGPCQARGPPPSCSRLLQPEGGGGLEGPGQGAGPGSPSLQSAVPGAVPAAAGSTELGPGGQGSPPARGPSYLCLLLLSSSGAGRAELLEGGGRGRGGEEVGPVSLPKPSPRKRSLQPSRALRRTAGKPEAGTGRAGRRCPDGRGVAGSQVQPPPARQMHAFIRPH